MSLLSDTVVSFLVVCAGHNHFEFQGLFSNPITRWSRRLIPFFLSLTSFNLPSPPQRYNVRSTCRLPLQPIAWSPLPFFFISTPNPVRICRLLLTLSSLHYRKDWVYVLWVEVSHFVLHFTFHSKHVCSAVCVRVIVLSGTMTDIDMIVLLHMTRSCHLIWTRSPCS